jgi:hypothetical protein
LQDFLRERLRKCDALILDNIKVDRQNISARIVQAYTSNHHGPESNYQRNISFVGAAGTWGDVTLVEGEKALAFVCYLESSKRYYQYHWRAHFPISNLNGVEYAMANWNHNGQTWWPEQFRELIITPNVVEPWKTGVPFALLEEQLKYAISN